jgi:hypothetical protein
MYDGLALMNKPAELIIYWDGNTRIAGKNHLILKYETDGRGNINGKPALNIGTSENIILQEAKVLKEYESQVSTDKKIMKQVLQDMKSYVSTDKIGLIIGSHGSAWLNTIYTSGRAIGYDDKQSNSILLPDLVEALESVNQKFEFILFDACYMGTIEVCHEFQFVTDYLISSVMEVPAYGFPYDMFMGNLYEGNVAGYEKVCKSFIEFYQEKDEKYKKNQEDGESCWGTVSLIDCTEISSFTKLLKDELVSHKQTLSSYNSSMLQEYGRSSGYGIAYDLEQFIKNLNGGIVPKSFETQLKKTILYKDALYNASYRKNFYKYDVDATNYCGLGIYIPNEDYPQWNKYFKTLEWYTASGWNEVSFSWNF